MSSGVLSPNLTKKFQWEVSQIAEKKFLHAMLLGGLSVNLNHLRRSAVMKICELSAFSSSDLEYLSHMHFENNQCSIAGNISIFMKHTNGGKHISLASNGGHIIFCVDYFVI